MLVVGSMLLSGSWVSFHPSGKFPPAMENRITHDTQTWPSWGRGFKRLIWVSVLWWTCLSSTDFLCILSLKWGSNINAHIQDSRVSQGQIWMLILRIQGCHCDTSTLTEMKRLSNDRATAWERVTKNIPNTPPPKKILHPGIKFSNEQQSVRAYAF